MTDGGHEQRAKSEERSGTAVSAHEERAVVGGRRVLARSASGLRHLRWTREVLGSLLGFEEHGECLSELQREALRAEIERVSGLVVALSAAVKPYRDFLERTRTKARGKVRAADFLVAGGTGLASPPGAIAAREIQGAARGEMATVIAPERAALREALGRAIEAARAGLVAMDEHLATVFSPELVAALYPELALDGERVSDDGDPDDDAAGGHEAPR